MDTSALRKLSLTLKPLIEIVEVLEKIEGAEQQLGSIKGRTVAAQREYEAVVDKMAREKNEADAKVCLMLDKAKKQAETILKNALAEADGIVQKVTASETKRLEDLRNKIAKAEEDAKIWDERVKKLIASANTTEARLKTAEQGLAELRAAHAAVRI